MLSEASDPPKTIDPNMNSDHQHKQLHNKDVLSADIAQASTRLYFGGSFDPVHQGHIKLPAMIGDAIGASVVVYVPAARSPHKTNRPTADVHRIAMLNLAMSQMPQSVLWTTELSRNQTTCSNEPSYWADTWRQARKACPDGVNRFLIGADQARSMHRWLRYTEFWRDAVVMLRGGDESLDHLINDLRDIDAWNPDDIEYWRSLVIEIDQIDVSSSAIRASLADPCQRETCPHGLDEQVHAYILEHDLYRSCL